MNCVGTPNKGGTEFRTLPKLTATAEWENRGHELSELKETVKVWTSLDKLT